MKKILFFALVCSSVTYFSCSSEQDVETQNAQIKHNSFNVKSLNSADLDYAKKLYASMILTSAYKDFDIALKSFNEKIFVDVSLKNEKEWLNWIQGNLSNTAFTNVEEFEGELYNVTAKLQIVMQSNVQFFNLLHALDGVQLLEVMPIRYNFPQYSDKGGECLQGCVDAYESGYADAWAAYNEANSDVSTPGDLTEAIWRALGRMSAQSRLDKAIYETLPLQYASCAGAC